MTNAENTTTVASSELWRERPTPPLSRAPVDSRGIGMLVGSFSSSRHGSFSRSNRFTMKPSSKSTDCICVEESVTNVSSAI